MGRFEHSCGVDAVFCIGVEYQKSVIQKRTDLEKLTDLRSNPLRMLINLVLNRHRARRDSTT